VIAAALLLAATPVCAVSHPVACADTNVLARAPGFLPMLRRFFRGVPPASLLFRGGTLADQAAEVLGGPPDDRSRIGPFHRFTACRAHSCPEKGALVLTEAGEPVAVAILHSPCPAAAPPPRCSAINLLRIYTRPGATPAVVADLKRWARTAVAGQPLFSRPPLIRVIALGEAQS